MVTPERFDCTLIYHGTRAGGIDVVQGGDLYIKIFARQDATFIVGESLPAHMKVATRSDLRRD